MNLSLQNTIVVEKLFLQRADGLHPAAIAIVRNSLDQLREMRQSFLHEKELEFFDTLKFPKVQLSYLLGRYAAKMALKAFMNDVVVTEARVGAGVFQQPVLYLVGEGNVQLSISHSTEMAIAVVFQEGHPMGVDVEAVNTG